MVAGTVVAGAGDIRRRTEILLGSRKGEQGTVAGANPPLKERGPGSGTDGGKKVLMQSGGFSTRYCHVVIYRTWSGWPLDS